MNLMNSAALLEAREVRDEAVQLHLLLEAGAAVKAEEGNRSLLSRCTTHISPVSLEM